MIGLRFLNGILVVLIIAVVLYIILLWIEKDMKKKRMSTCNH